MTISTTEPFVRDRLTWMAYFTLAYIAFTQAMLGPLLPFLRVELGLNYTRGGLLPGALAAGLVLSGLLGSWLAGRWGRRVIFWSGAAALAVSALLLGLSHRFGPALLAVLGMGVGSSLTQVIIQALLADRHGERRSIAITEANVAASLSATLTPLVIGGLQSSGLGWRAVPVLISLFLVLLAATFRRDPIPEPDAEPPSPGPSRAVLPASFWLFWIVLFLIVAAEMVVAVWAAEFLASVVGLRRVEAAFGFSAFPAAMLIGRFAGSRLTRSRSSLPLLGAALLLTLVGFPLFWLARLPALNILGLFLTGLGMANQYPLTLSISVGLAGGRSNLASARASLAVGTALLSAPLLLGWLADRVGLQNAYSLVIILLLAASGIVMNNILTAQRRTLSGQQGKIG